MSFGFSPSDIVALIQITLKAYQGWKHACGEYADITGSLDSLLIVLKRIDVEASRPESVLTHGDNAKEELRSIIRTCDPTVRELHSIVVQYKSLSASRQRNWDRLRFGNKNLDGLRAKLILHISTITAYLETIGLGSLGRIEKDLGALPQLVEIVDRLAADIRAGKREGTVLTTYEDDEKEVWQQFRRELIGEGVRSSTVHKYKPQLKQYIRELAENGDLEENPLQGSEVDRDWVAQSREYHEDHEPRQPLLILGHDRFEGLDHVHDLGVKRDTKRPGGRGVDSFPREPTLSSLRMAPPITSAHRERKANELLPHEATLYQEHIKSNNAEAHRRSTDLNDMHTSTPSDRHHFYPPPRTTGASRRWARKSGEAN